MTLREFTFEISLPSSFDVLGLKYISSKVTKDYSIIYPRFKFNSDKFFITESKYLLNSFFSMFFEKHPELIVEYNDLSFFYKDREIKDTETCDEVFNKIESTSIVVNYI